MSATPTLPDDDVAPARPFSAVHVWIGETPLDEATFNAYFEADPAYWQVEDPGSAASDVTGCGFSIDLGQRYLYDDDLLGLHWSANPVPVSEVINGWPIEPDAEARILAACAATGLTTANAMFLYFDPDQQVRDPHKRYNGLIYVGRFANR